MADPKNKLGPELTRLLIIILIGGITPFLDTTIVNVAISTIVNKLHSPVSTVQWISTAYLLSLSTAIPLTAWGSKRFGSKAVWLFALAIFTAGSFLCGFAWSIESLIIFRILQGFGAGLMQPTMTTILIQAAGKEKRTGIFIATSNFAVIIPIFGPMIGGLIINRLPWQYIFFFNVPICITAFLLAWLVIPSTGEKGKNRLDFIGLFLLSPSVALIIFALSQISLHKSFGFYDLIFISAGTVLFALFIINSLRENIEPIIDLKLFRSRSFSVSGALRFLSGLAIFGSSFLVPLYCQQVRKMGAFQAGLMLSLQGVGFILVRWIGRPIDRLGPKKTVIFGMLLVSAATVAFTQAGVLANPVLLCLSLVLRGGGLGGVNVAISISAYQDLKHDDVPHGTSAIRILQQLGGSFGVALMAVILESRIVRGESTAKAFDITFWFSILLTMTAFLIAFLLPEKGHPAIMEEKTDAAL